MRRDPALGGLGGEPGEGVGCKNEHSEYADFDVVVFGAGVWFGNHGLYVGFLEI